MADTTKIPVINEAAGLGTPDDSSADREAETAVPEQPAWMKAVAVKAANRRKSRAASASPVPTITPEIADDGDAGSALSFYARIGAWVRTADARGYGSSFLLHFLVLLGMALWFLPQLSESTSITTVVESDLEAPLPFDAMDDVQLEIPAGSQDLVIPQVTDIIQQDAELNVLEYQFLQEVTAAETQGDGGSSDVGSGGFRLLEPRNAVRAGSFTAWTIPIARRFGEETKAGDSPRPGQDYHIVIQVKVPGKRKTYNISDLSGRVIGTDGYVQIIPAQAFTQEKDGRLVRAKINNRLPIVKGVVQILIRVPGAGSLVKDTIRVKSKLLKENQTLELIFDKRRRGD